jgi:predicted kinase
MCLVAWLAEANQLPFCVSCLNAMNAVILIGLQGAGKSTFYRERFQATHVHISLDVQKTRHREGTLLQECLIAKRSFVVDNTSPARSDRSAYIAAAKQAGFQTIGYYFQSRVEDCQRRNLQRSESEQIPFVGLLGTAKRLELPQRNEGFDELYYVSIGDGGQFIVEEWNDEV